LGFLHNRTLRRTARALHFPGCGQAIGILFSVCAVGGLTFYATESLKKWLEARQPCAHGIKSGALGACEACAAESRIYRLKIRAENQDRERRIQIRDNVLTLRKKEIKRLSEAWMTQASSYFTMTPRQFEDAIAELFRRLGYKVQQTPFSNDGGKDAIAWKDGRKFLIECKRFSDSTVVGRRDVQIFHSAVVDAQAEEGLYVTTGNYAHTAVEYAAKNKIRIYDGGAIPWLVARAFGQNETSLCAEVMCYECGSTISLPVGESTPSGKCTNQHEVLMNITLSDLGVKHIYEPDTPHCPRCGSVMRKVNKLGRRPFWGCSKYPNCRGTQNLTRDLQR